MKALTLILCAALAGCIQIPTASQQGGIDSMFSCVTYDPDTGNKTGEFTVHRDAIDRRLDFEKLEVNEPSGKEDIFSPCRIFVQGYKREQGDASLTGQALTLQAQQATMLVATVMEVLRAEGLILERSP